MSVTGLAGCGRAEQVGRAIPPPGRWEELGPASQTSTVSPDSPPSPPSCPESGHNIVSRGPAEGPGLLSKFQGSFLDSDWSCPVSHFQSRLQRWKAPDLCLLSGSSSHCLQWRILPPSRNGGLGKGTFISSPACHVLPSDALEGAPACVLACRMTFPGGPGLPQCPRPLCRGW